MVKGSDRVGRELPKEYREIVAELVANQGWRYDSRRGGGHPCIYPADVTKPMLVIPTTPGDRRGIRNFIADVRRRGGVWPVPRGGR